MSTKSISSFRFCSRAHKSGPGRCGFSAKFGCGFYEPNSFVKATPEANRAAPAVIPDSASGTPGRHQGIRRGSRFANSLVYCRFWWTHKGSNLGPLPCEGNALPLSYASGIFVQNLGPVNRLRSQVHAVRRAIYEVRGTGVKLPAANRANQPLARLAGAGGVGLQRPDAVGQRAAALGGPGIAGRAIGVRGFGRDRWFRRQHGLDG
jgi:hypothetical protein